MSATDCISANSDWDSILYQNFYVIFKYMYKEERFSCLFLSCNFESHHRIEKSVLIIIETPNKAVFLSIIIYHKGKKTRLTFGDVFEH